MPSRRRDIGNLIVTNLKKINGQISTFDPTYTYNKNFFNNVFRGLKFFNEINDFPSMFIQLGEESRIYHTAGLTIADLEIAIRIWEQEDNASESLENIIQDVEHVIYSMPNDPNLEILDIIIDNITTDQGLLDPYGFAEIFLNVTYEIEN